MDAHYFISYSSVDGQESAVRLRDRFVATGMKAWLATEDIPPASRWEDEIDDALRDCKAVFFLITPDSVHRESETRKELDRARQYKKPIVPLRFDPDALTPYSLEGRQELNFVGRFDGGLAELREHCRWLDSPEGEVYKLKCRIQDAERELPRERNELKRLKINKDLADLRESLAAAKQALSDTGKAGRDLRDKIDEGIRREQVEPRPARQDRVIPVVNRRPASAPSNFQNRTAETQLMGQFLEDPSKRLLLVVGRGGVGKTAMVCRMLHEIEHGRFPGDHVLRIAVGGIVYMGAGPARDISFSNLYADLCELLPETGRGALQRLWAESKDVTPRVFALANTFVGDPIILLLDNFEDFIDSSTQNISDHELDEVLRSFLALPDHSIKVIITSQVTPRALALYQPGRQMSLNLNEGLSSPHAEKLLQLMDGDGSVGLRDAAPAILDEIRKRTQGIPRALEAFYGILAADRYTSVSDILADAGRILPDNVVQELVARAYHRLDEPAQRVFQALAVYGEPVIAEAVDFLLQPLGPATPSEPVLRRLVGMFLVRHDAQHFFLHPVDAAFALTEIRAGANDDWESGNAIFTRKWLFHRGAAYFRKIRRAEASWRSITDLGPVLAEFNLLVGAGDHEAALEALETILPYLDRWGHARQIERLAARLAREASQPIRTWAAGLAGRALSALGEAPAAIEYIQSALDAPPEQIDVSALLDWRLTLGDCHFSLGNYEAAEAAYQAVFKEAVDDSNVQAMALLGLGAVAEVQSRPQEAEQHYGQALTVCASQLGVAFVEESGKTLLAPSALAPELPLGDPFSWRWLTDPISITDSDSEKPQEQTVWLYSVEVPRIADASPPPEAAREIGEQESPGIEVALVRPTPELARIWMGLAGLYASTGRLREADTACRLAARMCDDLRDNFGAVRALDLLRRVAAQLSDEDADEIANAQQERLQSARDAGDRSLEISILNDLAKYHLERRRYADAEATYKELGRHGAELENPSLLADAEIGLAQLDWIREKPDAAITKLEKLRQHRPQELRLQSDIDLLLARIEFSRGRRDSAARHCHKAAAGYSVLGLLSQQIEADRLLASIAIDTRDYDRAVRLLQGTVELSRAVGIPSLVTSLLCDLAKAHLSAGQREAAVARIEEATRNASKIELPYTQAEALMAVGYIRSQLRNFASAEEAYQRAQDVYKRLGNLQGQYQTLSGLSRLHYLAGQSDKSLMTARAAWQLISSLDDPSQVRAARMELATALSENGFHAEAIEHMQAIVHEEPTATNIGNFGWVLYAAGEYARSLEQSRRALELDPSAVWVIRNIAHAYLATGRADDAEKEYKRAIQTRKGGEDFFESIRIVRKLASERPDLPRVREMLQMLEKEQSAIEG